jgi:1-acyl-sn-glycerol-3-phosphate acyltransferase
MNLYKIGKFVSGSFLKSMFKLEIIGVDKFPKTGGVLLCSNHISNLDPPLVGSACPKTVHFMAKSELFNIPVLKQLLPAINAFPVKRGMSDKQALRIGLSLLNDGKVLGLFPEGTRSKNGEVGKGLAGAGFFALRSQAKVVPCAVQGSYKPFQKLTVTFGDPIDFDELRERKASAQEATDLIMASIRDLTKSR